MKTYLRPLAVVVAGAVVLSGCGRGEAAGPMPTELEGSGARVVVTDAPARDDVVTATWQLGIAAARTGDGTAVVSPSSLVTALAMLGEGAVGDESAPFDAALGAAGQDRTDAVNVLQSALARYDGDPAVVQADTLPTTPVLHTAQRIVVDDDVAAAPAFLDRLQRGYGAGVLTVDLASDAGLAALSAWVDQHTGGLVKQTGIKPDESTLAVLQDALVLAAAWQQPFDPDHTHEADFSLPSGAGTVAVPTMHAELDVPLVVTDQWTAVRLPYADGLTADLMLPSRCDPSERCPEVDNPALADAAVVQALSERLDSAPATTVEVALPTLDLATRTDLMGLLTDLGIAGHRLTGVRVDGEPVVVSQAVQQTVLKIDEDGTRAAAVTEIAMTDGAAAPREVPEVRFDRPFILVVRDSTTGWPVLLASVLDPR
ncbi:MAG: serpin family protein [Micrococcales bacterium]|nr:serpin family protein [Micrococcales bacterium]